MKRLSLNDRPAWPSFGTNEGKAMKAIIATAIAALVVTATAAARLDPYGVTGYDARAITRAESPDGAATPPPPSPAIYGGSNNQRAPDFWNYDPNTGQKIADTSPGLTPEELTALYGLPTIEVPGSGGFAWDNAAEGAAVGFGFTMILAALALLIARSRRVVPAT
jgi:hypothetical protein